MAQKRSLRIETALASGLEGTYTRAAKSLYLAGSDKVKVKKVITGLDASLKGKSPNLQRVTDSLKELVFIVPRFISSGAVGRMMD